MGEAVDLMNRDTLTREHLSRFPASGFKRLANGWLDRLQRDLLTVICYHRVLHVDDHCFQGFKPTVSATPESFAQQMDYLRSHHNPIRLRDLAAWLDGDGMLPPRPALVTFDDGYRDNAEIAWPIMRERGVPAVIFLATDYIGTGRPFLWDFAAYCFAAADRNHADLPLIGPTSLITVAERDSATIKWVEAAKRLPGANREGAMNDLAAALDVPPPSEDLFRQLYLDWPDVRSLAEQGVEFGGHTRTHPILTRVPLGEAVSEIDRSIEKLTSALGSRPLGFAYPNGSAQDYSKDHEQAVRRSGVSVAFSLEPGPTSLSQVRKRPMAIRRIYVGLQDSMPRFIAKANGAARLGHMLRQPRRVFHAAYAG
jgi:peptidoglycan/xylan/chitin deacetylase (PgdA/CDA1 family)